MDETAAAALQLSVQQVINFILVYKQFVIGALGIVLFVAMQIALAVFVGRRLRGLNESPGD